LLLLTAKRPEAHVYYGDCNIKLLQDVFPKVRWTDYKRGLCLLDPYGLHLKWEVIKTAGHMRSIDMFLNFPIADMNRNILWRNPERVPPVNIQRMNDYWGDESWRDIAYSTKNNLWGWQDKQDNSTIASAFRERLHEVAGFEHRNDCDKRR